MPTLPPPRAIVRPTGRQALESPGLARGRMGLSNRWSRLSIGLAGLLWAGMSCSPALYARAPEGLDIPSLRGLSLTAALQTLQRRGLPIVFASNLVVPAMRVEREPEGDSLPELLAAILEPHGLRAVAVAGG